MFSTPDSWLGVGIVVMIGSIVAGLAICMGKSVIWLFGTGQEAVEPSGKVKATIKLHETA